MTRRILDQGNNSPQRRKGRKVNFYFYRRGAETQRVRIILAANNAKEAIAVSIFKTFRVPGVVCG